MQGTFLHYGKPSRLREVAVLPNSKKQTWKVKQNEEIEEYTLNERIRQNFRNKQNRNKQST